MTPITIYEYGVDGSRQPVDLPRNTTALLKLASGKLTQGEAQELFYELVGDDTGAEVQYIQIEVSDKDIRLLSNGRYNSLS